MRFLPLPLLCHPLLQRAFSSLVNVLNSPADQIKAQILEVQTGLPAEKEKNNPKDEGTGREKFPGTESAQMHRVQSQRNVATKEGMRNGLEAS